MPVTVPIPVWNVEGLLPAVDRANPTSPNRSPYQVSLGDVVMRFNTSQERAAIIQGFLDYRAALHGAGLAIGFQWLDGSFVEHIEQRAIGGPKRLLVWCVGASTRHFQVEGISSN